MTTATVTPRRICSRCKKSKTSPEFGWDARGATADTIVCQTCKEELRRNAEYTRKRRANNPDSVRTMNLWRLYKITPEEYDALRVAQDFRCAACLKHEDEIDVSKIGGRPRKDGLQVKPLPLQVDHCHKSNEVRGLLCPGCNKGLGHFQEDPEALRRAADYIEKYRR